MMSNINLAMFCLLAFAAAETTVTFLDEAEDHQMHGVVGEGEAMDESFLPFPPLSSEGQFLVTTASLEKLKARRLGSDASQTETDAAQTEAKKVRANYNTDFVCPEGGDPDKWITELPVANSVAKVHCVTGAEGSGKNHDGLSFNATDVSESIRRNGTLVPLKGDLRDGNSLGVSLPCTVAAVAAKPELEPFLTASQELRGMDAIPERLEAMYQSIEGTKSCAATTTFYRTGGLRMGTYGSGGDWADKIWARIVKLVVCVEDESDETFGEPGRKCAEVKRVTQCHIGNRRKDATPCQEGGLQVGGQAALSFVSML